MWCSDTFTTLILNGNKPPTDIKYEEWCRSGRKNKMNAGVDEFLRTNTPSCFCSVMILFMFVTVTVLIRANVVHFKGSMSIVPTSDALLCHYKSFKMTKKRFISPLQELKMQWFHWNGSGCFLLSCWWCCRAVCVSGNKLFNDSVWFLSVGVWKIRFNVP